MNRLNANVFAYENKIVYLYICQIELKFIIIRTTFTNNNDL
jgi:hypothetical protein